MRAVHPFDHGLAAREAKRFGYEVLDSTDSGNVSTAQRDQASVQLPGLSGALQASSCRHVWGREPARYESRTAVHASRGRQERTRFRGRFKFSVERFLNKYQQVEESKRGHR